MGTGGSGFFAEAAPSGLIGFFTAVAPYSIAYLRSDLKPARTSSEKSCGCSHAA